MSLLPNFEAERSERLALSPKLNDERRHTHELVPANHRAPGFSKERKRTTIVLIIKIDTKREARDHDALSYDMYQ